MTAALEQPRQAGGAGGAGGPGPAGGEVALGARVPRPPGRRGRRGVTTPGTLRALLAALVLLSLAWGAFGGWVASVHASAASAMASVDEPLSLDAQQLYASIADADVTATTMFLASSHPKLATLQLYQGDVATAAGDLSELRAAGGQNQVTSAALASLGADLPVYAGYVSEARSAYALGYPLTGGSFVQVASEEAHLDLLPAANAVFDQENDVLGAASEQATGLPLVIAALLLALLTGVLLYRSQRWLTRRTNRFLNLGLALATLLLIVSAGWLLIAFLSGRSDLEAGIGSDSQPAHQLAQASIDVQRIRGDAVLNVISRSGDASFQTDFTTTSGEVGPGDLSPGHPSLLSAAASEESSGTSAARLVAAAQAQATTWYTANATVYRLGRHSQYAGERDEVIGTGADSSAAGYDALEPDISRAIADDQAAFRTAVSSGSGALNPVEPVVIVAALLMALGCWRGLSRRLAEYR